MRNSTENYVFDLRDVHVLVNVSNVFLQMLANRRVLAAGHANHAEVTELGCSLMSNPMCGYETRYDSNLSESSQVKACQCDNLQGISGDTNKFSWCTYTNLQVGQSVSDPQTVLGAALTFLSDFEAPAPVQPVVYSP